MGDVVLTTDFSAEFLREKKNKRETSYWNLQKRRNAEIQKLRDDFSQAQIIQKCKFTQTIRRRDSTILNLVKQTQFP